VTLRAQGLDYKGWILVNGACIGTFEGSFVPVTIDLTPHLRPADNTLQLVFDCPPRWLGQIGYTSQMREWKPRFNYFWDWTSRLVQTGIWDDLMLIVSNGEEIGEIDCRTSADPNSGTGHLRCGGSISGHRGARMRMSLEREGSVVESRDYSLDAFRAGMEWPNLRVDLWWPNGEGKQPLYDVAVRLLDAEGPGARRGGATRRIRVGSMGTV
jgi:beta-mannosidase